MSGDITIGGREGFVVSRRFCAFRWYATGLPPLEDGDEGGVRVDLKLSEESGQGRVASGLEDRDNGLKYLVIDCFDLFMESNSSCDTV